MKQTIFGIILGVLLVLTVFIGFGVLEKYESLNASDYAKPTSFKVDIDGIKYRI